MKQKKVGNCGSDLPCVGLLAPEICAHGGVQSFMLRVIEVIYGLVCTGKAAKGYCVSLNDTSRALSRHPVIPPQVDVWGANRSKIKLVTKVFVNWRSTDVLFIGHLGQAPVAYLLKLLGRVRRYYVILHGIEAWTRVRFVQRHALLGADGIIATTRFTAEQCALFNGVPYDLFHIIPLCSGENGVAASPNFRLNGDFKLLCVARQETTEREKGFEHIFRALTLLELKHRGIHLNLVGKGNDQPRLKQVVEELGISSQVTFWGALSDENLAAAYEACDVFVMPSKKEGFGIVFLEAMRRGKPCIGGNHGGTPEVIQHGISGYLVEYGDVDSIKMRILTLVENKSLCYEMGRAGKELASAKFGYAAFQEGYSGIVTCHD